VQIMRDFEKGRCEQTRIREQDSCLGGVTGTLI
jgi:hypothetical protein